MKVDVIYARHLKPGDHVAGLVDMNAPTMPVQPFAVAHEVTSVVPYTEDGPRMIAVGSPLFALSPIPATSQVIVIRGT